MDATHSSLQSDRFSSQLASLPLFHSLTPQQLHEVEIVIQRKNVPAGNVLMAEAQVGEVVYVIAQGAVRICVRRGTRDVIIGIRGPGDTLGEMSVIDGDNRSATVITQTDCVLYWVSRADFWEVLWPIPPFSLNLTSLMVRRIRTLTGQIEAMATLSVQGRLARLILNLAENYGQPAHIEDAPHAIQIPFRLTQADLANMIGATRVQVNQISKGWKRRNLVSIVNGQLHVFDDATLKALII